MLPVWLKRKILQICLGLALHSEVLDVISSKIAVSEVIPLNQSRSERVTCAGTFVWLKTGVMSRFS